VTFSIVAFDEATGDLGVAVATRVLAVGRVVPWARAGVGAIATQAAANITYGPRGLELFGDGLAPEEAIARLTGDDPEAAARQVGGVDGQGRAATFTGAACQPWAGGRTGRHYACQGNILAGEAVVDAMAAAFERARGDLGVRLLSALTAGEFAGGDRRGKQSAALLVVREKGGFSGFDDRYIDLRVDDHWQPVAELGRVLNVWRKARGLPAHRISRNARSQRSERDSAKAGARAGAGVRAVDYVVYHVPDMRKAKAFYRKTLGLSPRGEYTATWAEFGADPTTLCLRATHEGPGAREDPGQIRQMEAPAVALAVDDVYAAVEELRTQGVQILVEPWETSVCFKAFIADPFGNPICLHQRKDGTVG
jgi:uncharacterized Ntn-hydrolase superfamily protein/catechol 2,3-dioxygenase-like lactoylglutathione lyase family enzyme